jgi:hypothetical protein
LDDPSAASCDRSCTVSSPASFDDVRFFLLVFFFFVCVRLPVGASSALFFGDGLDFFDRRFFRGRS